MNFLQVAQWKYVKMRNDVPKKGKKKTVTGTNGNIIRKMAFSGATTTYCMVNKSKIQFFGVACVLSKCCLYASMDPFADESFWQSDSHIVIRAHDPAPTEKNDIFSWEMDFSSCCSSVYYYVCDNIHSSLFRMLMLRQRKPSISRISESCTQPAIRLFFSFFLIG